MSIVHQTFLSKLTVNKVAYEDTFEFYVRDEKQVFSYPIDGERMRSKGTLRSMALEMAILSTVREYF